MFLLAFVDIKIKVAWLFTSLLCDRASVLMSTYKLEINLMGQPVLPFLPQEFTAQPDEEDVVRRVQL